MNGELDAWIVNTCEKYSSNRQIKIHAVPFKSNFSPDCGGNQKLTNVMKIITITGDTTMALNIVDERWNVISNAVDDRVNGVKMIDINNLNISNDLIILDTYSRQDLQSV